jgi:hypothetical protein
MQLFCQKYNTLDEKEDFDAYSFSCNTRELILADKNKFNELVKHCKYYNDKYLISIGSEDQDVPYSFYLVDYDHNDIDEQLKMLMRANDEDAALVIKLFIEKNHENKYIVVYNRNVFLRYLETIELENIFMLIKEKLFNKKSCLVFANDTISVTNNFLCFYDRHDLIKEVVNYDKQLENKIYCQCKNKSDSIVMPEYYYFDIDTSDAIILFFNRVAVVSSFCFLFSSVEIIGNKIFLQCNGYKTIRCEIDYKKIPPNKKIFIEISNWIYSSTGREDKLGLLHNILSLSINDGDDIFNIERDFFDSLKSNYNIYLRENINQYLQVKSKFIEQQIRLVSGVHELADNLIDNLKKNFIAFLSFFMTVIVLNSLSTGKLDYLFIDTITLISFFLLFVSLLILILSIVEIYFKWKRQKKSMDDLKKSYVDILNINDIDNIFEKNVNMMEEKRYLIINTVVVATIWLICLISIFSAICCLNSKYHLQHFIFVV